MVDPTTLRRFLFRLLFVVVCGIVIFGKLLPLSSIPTAVPGPDLIFCLTAVWIMRRPKWAPVLLIVLIHLLADILFLRPIGLWPAIALIGYEFLRRHATGPTEVTAFVEIGLAAGAFFAMIIALFIVQSLMSLSQPGFGAMLLHGVVTMAAYPFVMAFSVFILRVRRARPSDLEGSGVAA